MTLTGLYTVTSVNTLQTEVRFTYDELRAPASAPARAPNEPREVTVRGLAVTGETAALLGKRVRVTLTIEPEDGEQTK